MNPGQKKVNQAESSAWFIVGGLCFIAALYFGFAEGITDGITWVIFGIAVLGFRHLIR